ncbi:MAG: Uma2 family endonuclease [Anaerolineaceae bacterium]|nr:Uma2 family endonuclease [Anaerolineaceae bacterium]
MTTIQTQSMALDAFIEAYGQTPFEYVNGEQTILAPQVTRSSRNAGFIFRYLARFVDENQLGEVFIEAPFVLLDDSNWVHGSRTPDVMFYSQAQLEIIKRDPEWEDKPLIGPPLLAVEVVSPTDRYTDVSKKVVGYLEDGVQLIWVVEPKEQVVTVHEAGSNQHMRLTIGSSLDGHDILPDFSLSLSDLFQK